MTKNVSVNDKNISWINIVKPHFCRALIHVGKEIKKISKQRGLTANDLAEKIFKSRATVQRMFVTPDINTDLLQKICEVLDYDFFALYKKEEEEKEANQVNEPPARYDNEISDEINKYRVRQIEKVQEVHEQRIRFLESKLEQVMQRLNVSQK